MISRNGISKMKRTSKPDFSQDNKVGLFTIEKFEIKYIFYFLRNLLNVF